MYFIVKKPIQYIIKQLSLHVLLRVYAKKCVINSFLYVNNIRIDNIHLIISCIL